MGELTIEKFWHNIHSSIKKQVKADSGCMPLPVPAEPFRFSPQADNPPPKKKYNWKNIIHTRRR
jgi:hypothetical protein